MPIQAKNITLTGEKSQRVPDRFELPELPSSASEEMREWWFLVRKNWVGAETTSNDSATNKPREQSHS